jgi:hypothetical protein
MFRKNRMQIDTLQRCTVYRPWGRYNWESRLFFLHWRRRRARITPHNGVPGPLELHSPAYFRTPASLFFGDTVCCRPLINHTCKWNSRRPASRQPVHYRPPDAFNLSSRPDAPHKHRYPNRLPRICTGDSGNRVDHSRKLN